MLAIYSHFSLRNKADSVNLMMALLGLALRRLRLLATFDCGLLDQLRSGSRYSSALVPDNSCRNNMLADLPVFLEMRAVAFLTNTVGSKLQIYRVGLGTVNMVLYLLIAPTHNAHLTLASIDLTPLQDFLVGLSHRHGCCTSHDIPMITHKHVISQALSLSLCKL